MRSRTNRHRRIPSRIIAPLLVELRIKRDWSQVEASRALSCSAEMVQRIEQQICVTVDGDVAAKVRELLAGEDP